MSPKDPKETQKTLSISVQLNSVPSSPSKVFNPLNFVPVYSVTVYMQWYLSEYWLELKNCKIKAAARIVDKEIKLWDRNGWRNDSLGAVVFECEERLRNVFRPSKFDVAPT